MMRNLVRRSGSRPFSLERIISSMSPCSFSITTNTFSGVSNIHSRLTIPGCRRLWGGWGGGRGGGQNPGHPQTWDPRGQAIGAGRRQTRQISPEGRLFLPWGCHWGRGKGFHSPRQNHPSSATKCPEGSLHHESLVKVQGCGNKRRGAWRNGKELCTSVFFKSLPSFPSPALA